MVSSLCIYYLLLKSKLNLLHNSQLITFPTQSCLDLFSLNASFARLFGTIPSVPSRMDTSVTFLSFFLSFFLSNMTLFLHHICVKLWNIASASNFFASFLQFSFFLSFFPFNRTVSLLLLFWILRYSFPFIYSVFLSFFLSFLEFNVEILLSFNC